MKLDVVTVCSRCVRASCAQGVWPCESPGPGVTVDRRKLEFSGKEHPDFWTEEAAKRGAKRRPGEEWRRP